jgi:hypothetical protein
VLNCDDYNRKGRGFSEFLLDVAKSITKAGSAVWKKLCIRSLGTTMMPTSISVFWAPFYVCDKSMGVGANGLADLEKRFGFTFRCFPDAASLGFS